MSAAEIIEEIKRLPLEEQQKVVAFVRAAQTAGSIAQPSAAEVSEQFRDIANEVFTTNAKLFRKLAQ